MDYKLAIHMFFLCITNAYILYTKYGDKTDMIDHEEYILKIVEYLPEEGNKTRVLRNPPDKSGLGRKFKFRDHFPQQIPRKRVLRENHADLVLHAMDHGRI